MLINKRAIYWLGRWQLRETAMLGWILENNGFIIEAIILGAIVVYVGLKIK
ncbi:hypothetical protein [Marinobacterium lutimaris]|uniref:Uncharacterized protein n=1 Tax=Marinobacterium lutimaris TaxID=568106 RepID=A0A1H6CTP2_9GAMM|nr:hypothetical protein [Marinobacterium lutimaris]SEG76322.1 hypothetical protein SAMN05444390_104142 [Marinobacterium lutimaris]